MIISGEFLKKYCIEDYSIVSKFVSKKNEVYLLDMVNRGDKSIYYVVKKYTNPDVMGREVHLLKELKKMGAAVPHIYYIGDEYIVLEYIEGELLLDVLFKNDKTDCYLQENLDMGIDNILNEFCRWLKDFYSILRESFGVSMILGDINFRNFIFNKRIYGIDFEDCREGAIEEDAGRILAFSLSYLPAFTDFKVEICRRLLKAMAEKLPIDYEATIIEARKELLSIEKRRGLTIPPGILEKIYGWKSIL